MGVGNYGYHQSGSLQPTFEWQSFTEAYADDPLYPDIDAADLDISYDLRIYEARPFGFGAQFIPNADTSELFLLSTGDMEYEFYGISDTRFTPQIELEPCKPYTWTVRARFIADGKTHLTHWSGNYDEDEIEEYRERLTSESGGARMGRAISGFMGIDQQEYYRENAYYFPFLATPAAADCGDRLIREAIGR